MSFDLELTARCNNNCRHCYINLPAEDREAKRNELSSEEIGAIADEAVSLGAFWCLLTGGEPLLREDFCDIYLSLKRKGLLVSVFTNATLIREEHVKVFKRFPPRDLEVTVYGVSEATYQRVTRKPGSYAAHMRGLHLLLESGVRVRLKAMTMRSNLAEMPHIADFCRKNTKDYFRFDPFLILRYDGDLLRNREIMAERLLPEEIAAIEGSDADRRQALEKCLDALSRQELSSSNHLFRCGAGHGHFSLSSDGIFRLCSILRSPNCIYNLRAGNLSDAWRNFVPYVRDMRSDRNEYLENCRVCQLYTLCIWCPGHAHLETGEMDAPVEYFCEVAHARAQALRGRSR